MPRKTRFTQYDMLAEAGVFELNTANFDARDPVTGDSTYKGPVTYPKMFYHPKGQIRITVPSEVVATLLGPKEVGEQREIIWQLVEDEVAEANLRADGWHDNPVAAEAVRLGKPIPVSKDDTIEDLRAKLEEAQKKLDLASAPLPRTVKMQPAAQPASD